MQWPSYPTLPRGNGRNQQGWCFVADNKPNQPWWTLTNRDSQSNESGSYFAQRSTVSNRWILDVQTVTHPHVSLWSNRPGPLFRHLPHTWPVLEAVFHAGMNILQGVTGASCYSIGKSATSCKLGFTVFIGTELKEWPCLWSFSRHTPLRCEDAGIYLVTLPTTWKNSLHVLHSAGLLWQILGSFLMSEKNPNFTIFERHFCWLKNAKLKGILFVFFQYFKLWCHALLTGTISDEKSARILIFVPLYEMLPSCWLPLRFFSLSLAWS